VTRSPCARILTLISPSLSFSLARSFYLVSSSKAPSKASLPSEGEDWQRNDRQPTLYYLSNYTELDYSAKRRRLPRAELPVGDREHFEVQRDLLLQRFTSFRSCATSPLPRTISSRPVGNVHLSRYRPLITNEFQVSSFSTKKDFLPL